jgi:hypothetical protein
MLRSALVGLAVAVLVGTAFVPDDALAYRGGGARVGAGSARQVSEAALSLLAAGHRWAYGLKWPPNSSANTSVCTALSLPRMALASI